MGQISEAFGSEEHGVCHKNYPIVMTTQNLVALYRTVLFIRGDPKKVEEQKISSGRLPCEEE